MNDPHIIRRGTRHHGTAPRGGCLPPVVRDAPTAFRILLGESMYEVRHLDGEIVGATRLDVGLDVRPEELRATAARLGRLRELDAAVRGGGEK